MRLLGIDIGGTNIRVGLVEENELVRVESTTIRKDGNEKEIIDDLLGLIFKFDYGNVDGIGVGVPSVVDTKKGIVYNVQNIPSWKESSFKRNTGI